MLLAIRKSLPHVKPGNVTKKMYSYYANWFSHIFTGSLYKQKVLNLETCFVFTSWVLIPYMISITIHSGLFSSWLTDIHGIKAWIHLYSKIHLLFSYQVQSFSFHKLWVRCKKKKNISAASIRELNKKIWWKKPQEQSI